jgi:small GTP-binding protein
MSRPVVKAEGYDYIVKVIIIGDSNVGKTSIMKAFLNKEIPQTYLPTLGVDFSIKTINVDDKKVKMQIWDTAGQDRFKTITASYYRGAVGVLVVYAINDKASSKHVENWVKQIEEKCEAKIAKFLVGNKSDTER